MEIITCFSGVMRQGICESRFFLKPGDRVDRVGNDVREMLLSDAFRFTGHFLVPSKLGQQEKGSGVVYQGSAPPSGVSVFTPSSSHPQKLTVYLDHL